MSECGWSEGAGGRSFVRRRSLLSNQGGFLVCVGCFGVLLSEKSRLLRPDWRIGRGLVRLLTRNSLCNSRAKSLAKDLGPVYRSGTFNVQHSTLNFQCGDRKSAWWPRYGDRHDVWADGGANRGTDMIFGPGRRIFDTRSEMWGQTRCAVYRSGTFNVQRSTLNFQRSV